MNGRVYDPLLGRFGTPDPMTENPFSTQVWNRYPHVGTSPLNFDDPSGYFWQAPFKALGGLLRRVPILGQVLTVLWGAKWWARGTGFLIPSASVQHGRSCGGGLSLRHGLRR